MPKSDAPERAPARITLKKSSIYLGAAIHERYFHGLEAVILVRREDDLVIMPVRHTAAGGYLLKLRNSAGDRVVNAIDFFQSNGISDAANIVFEVAWNTELAALVAPNVFRSAN